MSESIDANELDRLFRAEWGRLLSGLIRDFGDFALAEDVLQEAFASALVEWKGGAPQNPRGWLYTAARHNAIDQLRRRARFAGMQPTLATLSVSEAPSPDDLDEDVVPDERLRLIFTCCHPGLSSEAQVALTLRSVCGLTTEEIARAFLVPATTMAQRLVRAKAKISDAGIPYRVPAAADLSERLTGVMAVIYLVFTEGYAATEGEALIRRELCLEAIRLGRLLRALLPEPVSEVDALLSLMLLHDARGKARVDDAGEIVLLPDQDRSLWNRSQIEEAGALLQAALRRGPTGPYALEAAIAAVHTERASGEDTDWRQIVALYERLQALYPSPVVALNLAVAVSMADGPQKALPLVDALEEQLASQYTWHSTRGALLRRLGRFEEAVESYKRAHALAQNAVAQRFLARQVTDLATRVERP